MIYKAKKGAERPGWERIELGFRGQLGARLVRFPPDGWDTLAIQKGRSTNLSGNRKAEVLFYLKFIHCLS